MTKGNATVLPPAPVIYNERPKKMSFEDFKVARANMNKAIKARLRGFLVHLSNELMYDELGKPVAMKYRKGRTFVGSAKHLQLV